MWGATGECVRSNVILNISKISAHASAEWFKCFRAFGNPMNHNARVFEITSPTKEIIISITFFKSNILCTPHSWSEACESCEQALVAVN